jgi:hypothetical protein
METVMSNEAVAVLNAVSAYEPMLMKATRDFAIGEKVSGRSQKQFLFWDLRSKKAIADWCRVGGCRLQGEVRYLKVEL